MTVLMTVILTCAACLLLAAGAAYILLGLFFSPTGSWATCCAAALATAMSATVTWSSGSLPSLFVAATATCLATLAALTAIGTRDR